MTELQDHYAREYGVRLTDAPGAGAAGGLGGGLLALGATLQPGFALVAEHLNLAAAIEGADLVVTGEGALDLESFNGKVVGEVIALARAAVSPSS
ncbi:glycerate kinase [Ornithinimicrobium sp. INDO-MA30-4]|uniref:glycerate kinase n=1 Tax=Ornithinimicrobium sp. INDO-MA30-4 TaxID=2908651 RepID=UPI001F36B3BE|nr:glycerate kinase [Ornithinimicrobium sp. INDO-MA30-4]UJH71635.1 glycerate kinase [Ornithinimicrobium sp. INDO-MA30-4]